MVKEPCVNEQTPSPPPRPASEDARARDEQEHEQHATPPPAPPDSDTPPDSDAPPAAVANAEPQERAPEPVSSPPPAPPRSAPLPPPLPSRGAPPAAPRIVTEPPQRVSEPPRPEPPPQPANMPEPPQRPDAPPYPPRLPAPQPAPPGSIVEPPRPYEGGRYVPPPPIPATGPSAREWQMQGYIPASALTPAPAAAPARATGSPLNSALLGVIALLLLVLAVLVGINTFAPRSAPPTGVQDVRVQRQTVKKETLTEISDTITSTQQALNQSRQDVLTAYQGAKSDAERQAILSQYNIFLLQIIAQQNSDLLLVYQDLYGQP